MRMLIAILTACLAASNSAWADGDHFDVKAADAPKAIERAAQRLGSRVSLTKLKCLEADGSAQKDVCTYRAGDGMDVLLRSTPAQHDIDDVTLICLPKSPALILSCVTTYAALIRVFTPGVAEDKGREIVAYISKGVSVGDSAQVVVEENRYVAQKVMGTLWMHIEPGDS